MVRDFSKPKKHINKKYVDRLRGGFCEVCGQPAEPHHVNGLLHERAFGSKNDYLCVMLCRKHHADAEAFPKFFWQVNNINGRNIVIKNLIAYIESMR